MDVQIDTDELRRQHRAHVERQRRLGGVSRRVAWHARIAPEPDAHVALWHKRCVMLSRRYPDADDHMRAWYAYRASRGARDWLHISSGRSVAGIISVVCTTYGISREQITSKTRDDEVMKPRHIAMYLAKKLTKCSMTEMGRLMGGRDHSTVCHGINKIEQLIYRDADFSAEVEALRLKLIGGDNANAR